NRCRQTLEHKSLCEMPLIQAGSTLSPVSGQVLVSQQELLNTVVPTRLEISHRISCTAQLTPGISAKYIPKCKAFAFFWGHIANHSQNSETGWRGSRRRRSPRILRSTGPDQ